MLDTKLPGDMSTHEVADPDMFLDLYEAGITELPKGLDRRQFMSVDLVKVVLGQCISD